jgi:RND family efflux transporter MFP subunit
MREIAAPEPVREHAVGGEPRALPPGNRAPARPRRWGGRLLAMTVLLGLAVALTHGFSQHAVQQRQAVATAQRQHDFVPTVRVAAVKASDPISVISLPATTQAFAVANINARASGYIEKRNVDIGDHVKKGQLLVQITAPELDHQIANAEGTLAQNKANVLQVQANLDLARITWARNKPLVEQGWATQQKGSIDTQTIKALEANLAVAQANVIAQQAQLEVLRQQKAYQRVVAPFDGVITQRNVDVGTLVQADPTSGTFLFTLMQRNVIRTQVFVPQDQAFGLSPGNKAVVRVPEIPDRTFPGKVTRLADALQPDTRTLLTEIDVPNPDEVLAVGIYCTVELHIPRKTPSLLVPADALIFNSDGPQVAVVENGMVRIRKVSVTRDLGTSLEVTDGVKDGDKVVLNPPVSLAEGNRVNTPPQAPQPPPATGGGSRALQ